MDEKELTMWQLANEVDRIIVFFLKEGKRCLPYPHELEEGQALDIAKAMWFREQLSVYLGRLDSTVALLKRLDQSSKEDRT